MPRALPNSCNCHEPLPVLDLIHPCPWHVVQTHQSGVYTGAAAARCRGAPGRRGGAPGGPRHARRQGDRVTCESLLDKASAAGGHGEKGTLASAGKEGDTRGRPEPVAQPLSSRSRRVYRTPARGAQAGCPGSWPQFAGGGSRCHAAAPATAASRACAATARALSARPRSCQTAARGSLAGCPGS